jgi:CheY-like chemotaxis protein
VQEAAAGGTGVVLLVDDEEVVRATTADMLSDLGYEVVQACTAAEALELMDAGLQPALLVSDHLMPGMTGTELIREVRRRAPATRSLLISGFADAQGVATDLPRLTKPFKQPELSVALRKLT